MYKDVHLIKGRGISGHQARKHANISDGLDRYDRSSWVWPIIFWSISWIAVGDLRKRFACEIVFHCDFLIKYWHTLRWAETELYLAPNICKEIIEFFPTSFGTDKIFCFECVHFEPDVWANLDWDLVADVTRFVAHIHESNKELHVIKQTHTHTHPPFFFLF